MSGHPEDASIAETLALVRASGVAGYQAFQPSPKAGEAAQAPEGATGSTECSADDAAVAETLALARAAGIGRYKSQGN